MKTQVIDDIFEVLVDKVATLEAFDYGGPVPSLRVLHPFAASNPNMKKVLIELDFPAGSVCPCRAGDSLDGFGVSSIQNGKRSWKAVMNAFLQNQALVSLTCFCDRRDNDGEGPHFTNLCTAARLRRVSVRMCNYQYF